MNYTIDSITTLKFSRLEIVGISILLSLAMFLPAVQDYRQYINQWTLISDGVDPWIDLGYNKSNVYGPIHLLFAPLSVLHPNIPRVLFTICGLLIYALLKITNRTGKTDSTSWYFFNPIIWITISIIGHNDTIIAALLVFGYFSLQREKVFLGGVLLGISASYKLYPLLVLPYLLIVNKRINWSLLIGSFVGFIVPYFFSYLRWGSSVIDAVVFNATRGSKFLSVFRFLRNDLLPFGDDLDQFAFPVFMILNILFFAWYIGSNIGVEKMSIITLIAVFAVYQVGHPQFQFTVIVMILFFLARQKIVFTFPLKIYIIWIVVVSISDHLITLSGHSNFYVREFAGLIHFLISVITILSIKNMSPEKP